MGDQVIPTNDTLREGEEECGGGGGVMLDDVGMHVSNLCLKHGGDPAMETLLF